MSSTSQSALRVGVIGLGNISNIHLHAFRSHPRVTIAAIADSDPVRLSHSVSSAPHARMYRDYRALLLDPSLDAVDILLPHHLHAEVAVASLEAGKHVICEKPLVTKLSDLTRLSTASRSSTKHIYLKQYFRFSTVHANALSMILGGEIGRPYAISCTYTTNAIQDFTDASSWRFTTHEAGGGVFMDVGVHMLDYLQELFGNPVSVSARMQKTFHSLPHKGEDVCVVTLEYRGSIIVTMLCLAGDTSYGFRWEKHFYGSEGSLHIEDFGKTKMVMKIQKNGHTHVRQTEDDWWGRANIEAIHDIVDRIIDGLPPAISLPEAAQTLKVVMGAYQSSETGKKIDLHF